MDNNREWHATCGDSFAKERKNHRISRGKGGLDTHSLSTLTSRFTDSRPRRGRCGVRTDE